MPIDLGCAGTFGEPLDVSDEVLAEIALILAQRRNFSISVYKDKCMKRRVAIRMRSTRCNDAAAYCNLLRQSDQELDQLVKALTIHVSQFFRNPPVFEKLADAVLPLLLTHCATEGRPLRVWSLGCASGEEAYSLAILLRERFGQMLDAPGVTISGSDIDADTLAAARRAEYLEDRLKELSAELRQRYFERCGQRFVPVPAIRAMVTFRQADIMDLENYPPSDLVMCRNTLIYFNRQDQERIQFGIARSLPPEGILVLGKSETLVGDARRLFGAVCPVERIYRRL